MPPHLLSLMWYMSVQTMCAVILNKNYSHSRRDSAVFSLESGSCRIVSHGTASLNDIVHSQLSRPVPWSLHFCTSHAWGSLDTTLHDMHTYSDMLCKGQQCPPNAPRKTVGHDATTGPSKVKGDRRSQVVMQNERFLLCADGRSLRQRHCDTQQQGWG